MCMIMYIIIFENHHELVHKCDRIPISFTTHIVQSQSLQSLYKPTPTIFFSSLLSTHSKANNKQISTTITTLFNTTTYYTTFFNMTSQNTFIELAWEIRDEFQTKYSASHVMRCPFPVFVQMVMDEYYGEGGTRSEKLVKFIENAITKQGCVNELDKMEKDDVLKLLMEGRHQRSYRLVLASDVMEDGDRRVRDVLQSLLSTKFPMRSILCSFFCERGIEKKRSHAKPSFNTDISTRFEQLLYIYCIHFVGYASGKMRGGKRTATTTAVLPDFDPAGAGRDRLAWALQVVVEAWDVFAKFLNFLDVEEMVHPYLLFKQDLSMQVLSEERVFVPKATKKGIKFPIVPTKDRELVASYVLDVSQETDEHLRSLTKMFLQDLRDVLLNNELYSVSTNDDVSYMDSFKLQDTKLPSRFEKLSLEAVKNTAKEVLDVKGKPSEENCNTVAKQLRLRRRASVPSRRTKKKRKVTSARGSSSIQKVEDEFVPLPIPVPDNNESYNFSDMEDDVIEPSDEEPSVPDMMKILESEMAPYARLHCCKFQEVVEVHEAIALEELEGVVQLLLTDPPYNIRRIRGDENSDYDAMTVEDMMEFVDLVGTVLRAGGHGIIFCSYQQHRRWVKLFLEKMMDNEEEDEEETNMFSVDTTPLITVRHPTHFTGNPVRRSSALLNSAEYAVHVKKNGLPYSEESQMVNYRGFNHVKSTMQGYRNVIDNVKALVPGEQVRMWDEDLKKSMPLRCEQKSIALMKEIICRFSQPNDIVLDTFAGTFSTAVACFQLPQPRRFIGCEADMECFNISRKHVLRRFSEVVSEDKQKFQLSTAGFEKAEYIASRRAFSEIGDEAWSTPTLFPAFQRLPSHLVSYLASDWNETALFLRMGTLPPGKWDEKYQARFEQVDVDHMVNVDASVQGLCIATSVNDGKMERKVFATKSFQPGEVVCKCYGSIVYQDLSKLPKSRKTYGNGVIGVSQEEFKLYGRRMFVGGPQFQSLPNEHLIHGKQYVYIVPAKFCVSRYIQKAHSSETGDIEQEGNVVFRHAKYRVSELNDLVLPDLIQLKARKAISIGDELCIQDDTQLIEL